MDGFDLKFGCWSLLLYCFLRQDEGAASHCLSPPICINGYQQMNLGKLHKMLGAKSCNAWTSIQCRREAMLHVRACSVCFMVQKQELCHEGFPVGQVDVTISLCFRSFQAIHPGGGVGGGCAS